MITIIITISLVNCFSVSCVSGEKPLEQRGVRHMEGRKESGRVAASPHPHRACQPGNQWVGGAGSAKMLLTALSDKGAQTKAGYFSKIHWLKIIP